MIVHIFLDFSTFYLSNHLCNNFIFDASWSVRYVFEMEIHLALLKCL